MFPGVRIKVCGLTNAAEAIGCLAAGADWVGLNFHPPSPRSISPALASEIIAALPSPDCAVGLFVDRPSAEVADLARRLKLTTLQLHGSESPEDLLILTGFRLIRAFRLANMDSLDAMRGYLDRCASLGRLPDYVLVDAFVPGQPGGTGHILADDLLAALRAFDDLPLILAGGLTPENITERLSHIRPWMVDIASGVETSPGRKDLARVESFVRRVRSNEG